MRSKLLKMLAHGMLVFALALVAQLAAPAEGMAQNCSECVDCDTCKQGWWGGEGCAFTAPLCPCTETGGNCNPTAFLNLDPENVRTVDGNLALARLNGPVFGTWDCATGDLRMAYVETGDGTLVRLEEKTVEEYSQRYSFEQYLRTNVVAARPQVSGGA